MTETPTLSYRLATLRAAQLMDEYVEYARSLGCTVVQDSILIDRPEHVKALSDWWAERTGVRHG